MGNLLRRYWYPIAATTELDGRPLRRVRLLGANLTLLRDAAGTLGLVQAGSAVVYPVEELAGLLWAYLGPFPAPLIPRIDGFVVDGAIRLIGKAIVPCNWLQIMENSFDPVHTEWLHGKLYEFLRERDGAHVAISRHHLKIRFQEFPYGVYKQRLLEGQTDTCDDWTVGHPVVFPNILATGSAAPTWRNYSIPDSRPDGRREHAAPLV